MSSRSVSENNKFNCWAVSLLSIVTTQLSWLPKQAKAKEVKHPANRLLNLLAGHEPGEVDIPNHPMDTTLEYYWPLWSLNF